MGTNAPQREEGNPRKRALWIPHVSASARAWHGSRQQHLARHLSKSWDLHWVDWFHSIIPTPQIRTNEVPEVGTIHTCNLPRTLNRLAGKGYPSETILSWTQLWFRRAVRRIVREISPDMIIWSSSHHVTGFPPVIPGIPVLYDHVDEAPPHVSSYYAAAASTIVAVSPHLLAGVDAFDVRKVVIPNGVELSRYQNLDKEAAKAKVGMSGTNVVSLIGLTCSSRLYFIDAVAARQDDCNLSLLIVGDGAILPAIKERVAACGIKRVHFAGHVPSDEVAPYFAATDIGLYPGDDEDYYRHASPLKIVEYAAAGCQVVSSPVDLFRSGWPCVAIPDATAAAFADAIADRVVNHQAAPKLDRLSWEGLSREFNGAMEATVADGRDRLRDHAI